MKKSILALLGVSSGLMAAPQDRCEPTPPPACNLDDCNHCYCLGPENYLVNAPVCPKTCNGDLILTVSGLYWHADQDGMEYAIDDSVVNPTEASTDPDTLNRLINAEYLSPDFKWNGGFKAGIGYCETCDGWDIGIYWTWYQGNAKTHDEAEEDDNHTLIPLWSAFASTLGSVNFATDIETFWKLNMNLIDIELGRNFWVSKYLSIRPHVGIRVAYLNQSFDIQHKGGSWSDPDPTLNNEVDLDNDFKGAGLRGGLDSTWNLGCGWAIYGNFATALVYGRFDIDHDEWNREASSAHSKTKVLETEDHFNATRAMLDLALGLQWSSMFCDCQYGLTLQLGWEQHIFFHQNQMWRVVRINDTDGSLPNNTGENVHHQRRGTLETEGLTFTVKFDF